MDAAQRQLSDQLDQATQRLLDAARVITEPDLRVPSLLDGWTRAHVLAHLARGGDAMRRVLAGVRSGHDRPAYASAQARQAEIEESAGRRATEHGTWPTRRWHCAPWPGSCPAIAGRSRCGSWTRRIPFPRPSC